MRQANAYKNGSNITSAMIGCLSNCRLLIKATQKQLTLVEYLATATATTTAA